MSDSYTPFAPLRYDQQAVARQGYGMAHSGPDESQLIVGFFKKAVQNRAKSQEMGSPIYESRDFVKIQHPGENLNIVEREATDQDKARFPNHWRRFIEGTKEIPDGMPLSLLFLNKPEIEATLRGYNIHTVEQLANLSAHAIGTVGMGCQDWVNAAKRYLERAEKGVDHHHFEKAMKEKDTQIQTLRRQVEEMSRIVNQKLAIQEQPNAQTYDFQSAQIAKSHPSANEDMAHLQPPVQFVTDLSEEVQPSKRRGRPPGSRNKEK